MSAQPQWIAKMYPEGGGRDHLGLGSVSSDQILPSLSPGVNVLTPHPRYHSFYVFLLDEFWSRERTRSRASWTQFYRPREFIFSLGAHLCDRPQHGDMRSVVGRDKTQPLAERGLTTYDTTTHYIKSPLGGYGLYYRSVLADLGLIYPGGPQLPTPIDVPTERGKEVAASFRRALEKTAYYRDFFDQDAVEVPRKVIVDYIRRACLCQLQEETAPDRQLVLDAFLHGGPEGDSVARRATLRLLLDVADQTKGRRVNQDSFRQLLYFGATKDGGTYSPRLGVDDTHRRWRLYQAREYYVFAINALWYHLCDWGLDRGGDLRPITLEELWSYLPKALSFKKLAKRLNVVAPDIKAASRFDDLVDWLERAVGGRKGNFDQRCKVSSPIQEHLLYRLAIDHRTAPEVTIAGMITLLALVSLRFGDPELRLRPEWKISRAGAEGRLSVDSFIRELQRRSREGANVLSVTRWLFEQYVISQHQLVASSKLPDNTFRFWREGPRLRFFDYRNRLEFNDSRFDAISTTAHELGLCGKLTEPRHVLTSDGRRFLSKGDLDAGA